MPKQKSEKKKDKKKSSGKQASKKSSKSLSKKTSKSSKKSLTPKSSSKKGKKEKGKKQKSPVFRCIPSEKDVAVAESVASEPKEQVAKPVAQQKQSEAELEQPFDPFVGLSEEARDELKCKLCEKPFDKPKALPCLHTFCENCIANYVAQNVDNAKFPCPSCQNTTEVPPTGLQGLRDNYFVRDMLAILPKPEKTDCDFCKAHGSQAVATNLCTHCGDHLCNACSISHNTTKITKDHKVVTLKQVRAGEHVDEMRTNQKVVCTLHPAEEVNGYCEGCAIPICPSCKTNNHTGHKIATLEMALVTATNELKPFVEPMNNARVTVDSLYEGYTKANEEQKQDPKSVEQAIRNHFNEVRRMADEKEKAMLEKLGELVKKPKEDTAAKVRFTVGFGARLLELGKDAEKLQHAKDLCQRLKDLQPVAKQFGIGVYKFNHKDPPDINTDVAMRMDRFEITADGKVIALKPKVLEEAVLQHTFKLVQPQDQNEPGCLGFDVLQGRYFTTDWTNKTVKIFDKHGNQECELPHDDKTPLNEVLNVQAKDIIVYGMNFKNKVHIQGVYRGYGAVAVNDNQVIIADHKHLITTDETGSNCKFIGKAALSLNHFNPFSVACYTDGNIVVTDWKSKCVHIVNKEGTSVLHTYKPNIGSPTELKRPRGVGVDEWGQIVVLDSPGPVQKHKFHLIDGTGTFIASSAIKDTDKLRDPTALSVIGEGQLAIHEFSGDVKFFKYLDT